MKQFFHHHLSNFKLIAQLFSIASVSLFLSKVVFYLVNKSLFEAPSFGVFLGAFRFDAAIIGLLLLPVCLILFLPFFRTSLMRKVILLLWVVLISVALVFNYIDVQYFRFTGKRTTADLFAMQGLSNDLPSLILSFLKDFWYLILLLLGQIYLLTKFSSKALKKNFPSFLIKWQQHVQRFILLPMFLFLFGIIFRGIGLKPISNLDALYYGNSSQTALILNTPFTIIQSFGKQHLVHNALLSKEQQEEFLPFTKNYYKAEKPTQKKNVVLLIVESLGEEYLQLTDSSGRSYTPFLDSLKNHCTSFQYSFANGKRSIDAIPALFSSIPSWMETPFVSSVYSTNTINSLPQLLGKKGYSTSFYHGGKNGTMGFDSFCKAAGVQEYFGLNEYPNPEHFDGSWGIPDMLYLQYVAEKIKEKSTPAFHSVFTLSSHHPYKVPEPYHSTLPKHDLEIMHAVAYTDASIKAFFESLKTWEGFENTLFVLTADHTSLSKRPYWYQPTNTFRVPIWFYEVNAAGKELKNTCHHIDVFPTVIDYLNFPDTIYSLGKSAFEGNKWSINYIDRLFYLHRNDTSLSFAYPNFDEPVEAFHYTNNEKKTIVPDSLLYNSNIIKASVDQFYIRLNENALAKP